MVIFMDFIGYVMFREGIIPPCISGHAYPLLGCPGRDIYPRFRSCSLAKETW